MRLRRGVDAVPIREDAQRLWQYEAPVQLQGQDLVM